MDVPILGQPEVEYVTVPSVVAKGVDYLAKLSTYRSPNGLVETEKDWYILGEAYKVWRTCYPEDYRHFVWGMSLYKRDNDPHKGIKKEQGGAMIQHKLEVPEKLYKLWESMFPRQNYDKKFVRKLADRLPELDPSHI